MSNTYSMESLGYGLLAIAFLVAVVAVCTAGRAALKRYIRKTSQEVRHHEK